MCSFHRSLLVNLAGMVVRFKATTDVVTAHND
jgi:hypothetical protein